MSASSFAITLLAAGTLMCSDVALAADAYPVKPVRLIIPAPPGGATDLLARALAQNLAAALGQQVIVDNRGGGRTLIASELAVRAVPDGHTIFLANSALGTNPALIKALPYDTLRDFAPISLVADSPLVLVAHPSLGVSTLKELIVAAKARPGVINYGSSSFGTGGHLAVELLKWMAGIDIVNIPYKGAAPALADVVGGQLQLMCTSPLTTLPHVRAGRLRALAMTSRARARSAPDIPTVAESGFPGYQASLWYPLVAPAATPAAVMRRLSMETVRIMRLPAVGDQLLAQGVDPIGSSPQELAAFLRADIEKWKKVVPQMGIAVQ